MARPVGARPLFQHRTAIALLSRGENRRNGGRTVSRRDGEASIVCEFRVPELRDHAPACRFAPPSAGSPPLTLHSVPEGQRSPVVSSSAQVLHWNFET